MTIVPHIYKTNIIEKWILSREMLDKFGNNYIQQKVQVSQQD